MTFTIHLKKMIIPYFFHRLLFKKTIFCLTLLFCWFGMMSAQISGTVVDASGLGLIGANIVEKGTNNGTIADADGNFTIDVKAGTILQISFTGYDTQELAATDGMNVVLIEGVGLDEIVVTGVFDARSAMESSVAITTLNADEMARLTPVSTADLFANTPGVFVNSAAGETRNQVYARGVSAGSNYSSNI